MASFTPRGFQQDESFWEVGLHLGLMVLFALPLGTLAHYLAGLAHAEDRLQPMFAMLVGLGAATRLVGWARWKLRLSPQAPTQPPATQPLYWALPVAFAIAIGFDRLLTAVDTGDTGGTALGLGVIFGGIVGDAVFHGLRSRRKAAAEEDKPS